MSEMTRREFIKDSAVLVAAGTLGSNGISSDLAEAAEKGGSETQAASAVISLPKGGGAVGGIGETFKPNLFTGTGNLSVPIATSPGRDGFGPELNLQYSTGNGNGPFGMGWALSVPQVSRKTEKGLPRYTDDDTFLLSGAEDLVPRSYRMQGVYQVTTYRPRLEGLFARIEKWEREIASPTDSLNDVFWKITTKDNITNIYGQTPQATLADRHAPRHIYRWLLELTYDAKGNYIRYEYKDDGGGAMLNAIYEANRESTQIYLKRIRYGNLTPFAFSNSGVVNNLCMTPLADEDHFFTVVFDYGEHGKIDNAGHEVITENIDQEFKPWDVRSDHFSSFRAGFEIRTYRRCKRVLMFHNRIPGEPNPVLVQSTDFHYAQNDDTNASMLMGVVRRGYKKSNGTSQSEEISLGQPGVKSEFYEIKSIPRLDFGYTDFKPNQQRFKACKAKGGDLPPRGLNDPNFALVDLFGTGLSDVLQTTPQGYYYWRNLGDGLFDRRQLLKNLPAGVTLAQDSVGFGDMAGDGQADLLVHTGRAWGFYEATNEGGWNNFRPYRSVPSFNLNDSNTRMVDLTGDGKADALTTDARAFRFFPCKGEEGFDEPKFIRRTRDLDEFPDVYFNDPRVQLADMTGDGLKDIVFVHSGRIDYWPNLGYGRFGKRITMKNAPHFGPHFDPNHLFIADIDGDGPADMVYVESGQVQFWFNQCGNSWSQENTIHGTPSVGNVEAVLLADLFGNGTTGILWSTDYRRPGQSNYLFLDLAGGVKPYVLNEVTNNMGATTRSEYKPSTHFYLEDLKQHKPWVSTVPFPVQVLAKTEMIDHIGKSKLVTEYAYHHGYYDGREREFRGFGSVDQLDTERFDDYNNQSSSLHGDDTRFNTTDSATYVPPILTKSWFHTGSFADEAEHLNVFRREYYRGDSEAFSAHSDVQATATPFEAYRALNGAILRTEVYALDDTSEQYRPYTVTESGFQVKLLQPKGANNNGVFFTASRERFQFHYERNPEDPRISHQIIHKVDEYGNIEGSLNIVYPRRSPAYPEQSQFYITYDENTYINQDDSALSYFVGLSAESKQTELDVATLTNTPLLPEGVESLIGSSDQNLLSHSRNYYDGVEYQGLPVGEVGAQGLLTRTEILALNAEQLEGIYGDKVQSDDVTAAGYIESPEGWWVPAARIRYGGPSTFFLSTAQKDPMGNVTSIEYDIFSLLPMKTIAPLDTVLKAENDYRTLFPYLTIDPNLNRTQIAFDALGMVTATALMGVEGGNEGDTIQHPTVRMEYDFYNYWRTEDQPNFVQTFKREEHYTIDANAREQESYTYSDGFGREIQTKIEADRDPVNGNPRWIGSGWRVYNNKGWIVEQYEPFFSHTHEFEDEQQIGVSAKMAFDPLGRAICTDSPDGTFGKVEFDPWLQTTWDGNDTVALINADGNVQNSRWYIEKSSGTPQEQEAAQKALTHRDTPTVVHLDTLGRSFLSVADNGNEGKYEMRTEFDVQGNVTRVIDARQNTVIEQKYDLLKNPIHGWQMDSGERTILLNPVGKVIKAWDSREHLVETEYDPLNRLVELWVTELISNTKRLADKIVYGENRVNPENQNLRGQVYQQYDGAGMVTYEAYDFKGNPLGTHRQLLDDYKTPMDWDANPTPSFTDDDPFEFSTVFDALGRVVESAMPDDSRFVPTYNAANLLETVNVNLRGAASPTPFVLNIDYNAKGQREKIEYANGVTTEYTYAPETFRLTRLLTTRVEDNVTLQDLDYTYDAVGNITEINDDAQRTVFFNNAVASPNSKYEYDALYRLVKAEGREHAGQNSGAQPEHSEFPRMPLPHPNDAQAMRRYTERYEYDKVGNIVKMAHTAAGGNWTRHYEYASENNRLLSTNLPGDNSPGAYAAQYDYDVHGNMTKMPHLPEITWDFKDQMEEVDLGGGRTAYYVYDAAGERVRKVEEKSPTATEERIYLGGYEIYRKRTGDNLTLERETLHTMDDQKRVALVETKSYNTSVAVSSPDTVIRYQVGNHLGSASLELDENGAAISYEEFYPYGTSAYHSTRSNVEVSLKRYRYTGRERDDETGLNYYGARYYAAWLGRWLSTDPIGLQAGINAYVFVHSNPINRIELDGMQDSWWGRSVAGARKAAESWDRMSLETGALAFDAAELAIDTLGIENEYVKAGIRHSAVVAGGTAATIIDLVGEVALTGPNALVTLDEAGTDIGEGAARIVYGETPEDKALGLARVAGGVGQGALVVVDAAGGPAKPGGSSRPLPSANTPGAIRSSSRPPRDAEGVASNPSKPKNTGSQTGSSKPKKTGSQTARRFNSRMANEQLEIINSDPNHILKGLVNPETGNFYSRRHGADVPAIQVGHGTSLHSGAPERLFLEDADFNQLSNWKGERQGAIFHKEGVLIGQVHIEMRTARSLENLGMIPPGTVDNAPRSTGWVPR